MPAYKYKLKDGKTVMWYAAFYYEDWAGVKKHKVKRGFKTQREAKEFERTFLNSLCCTPEITYGNLVEAYLEDMSHRSKPTTIENKKTLLYKKLVPYFGSNKIADITSAMIRKWQNEMIDYRDENGKPYSETYLRSMHAQLSATLNYAVAHYGLQKNPCLLAGTIGKGSAEEMNFWTKEEYDQTIEYENKPLMKLAFDTMFYAGLRCGELLALTPEDILPDRKIRINKNYQKVKDKEYILIPKTDTSKRTISIPESLYQEYQDYMNQLYFIGPQDRIFEFTRAALDKEIHRLADRAGSKHIRVHDLRHSHASMLIHMGVDIKALSKRLGHKSIKITLDTYGHLYPDADTSISKMLEDMNTTKSPEK